MARPKLETTPVRERNVTGFLPSGSHLLDKVLGGNGWALGRMANLVGDKSTGKTLLAIEACANMAKLTKPEYIRYGEAESAFDEEYAQSVGCPQGIRLTEPGAIRTVQDFYNDFREHLELLPGDVPGMYVLDSFDALTTEADDKREFGEAAYGDKAKIASEFFRKIIADMRVKNCFLLIISQLRDNIGVTFGEKHKRSGGHALDFYATQIVWLRHIEQLTRTVSNIKRVYGVEIQTRNKKCKVGPPFREAEMPLLFGYGIDDETAMANWLKDAKAFPLTIDGEKYTEKEISNLILELRVEQNRLGLNELNTELRKQVDAIWDGVETALQQPMSKY